MLTIKIFKFVNIASIFMVVFNLSASDMKLTIDSGGTILLHDDHTWDFINAPLSRLDENMMVNISSNQIVEVSKDFTWRYITEIDVGDRSVSSKMGSAYATGNAAGLNKSDVAITATLSAAKQLAKQLFTLVENDNITIEMIAACVESGDKIMEISENHSDKWYVKVKLTVNDDNIKSIIECANNKIK